PYFSVAAIYSMSGTRYPLLDGGVFAPNPSMSALAEVTRAFNETKVNDISIVSLGTGRSRRAYDYEHFKKSRAVTIGPALIDIMMSGASESSDFFLQQLYKTAGNEKHYIRIEPGSLRSIDEELDAASQGNIEKLVAFGDRMVSENNDTINQLVDYLLKEHKHSQSEGPWWFSSANESRNRP